MKGWGRLRGRGDKQKSGQSKWRGLVKEMNIEK